MKNREIILELANHLNRTKTGSKSGIKYGDPEYRILEPVVSDEMAEVGMHLAFRKPLSAEDISPLCGKTVEETSKLLWQLAEAGVSFVNKIDGVDKYWTDLWVPGIMEMMAGNLENVKKHPEIAVAFNDYGLVRGAATAGNFPVGLGLMRVIPIEQAISGETRRASYEEVSKYLYDNDIFSVADCSCRTVRKSMGEGCGHLSEDMCIQLGHAAEYYIRTGRGREITREEAFAIINKAEENGLMHQIPNTDGPGETHAICNCCGCSCLSLRTAEMFLNNDMVRSNYTARVDREKCTACGQCVENCPVNALKLGQKLCSSKPIIEKPRPLPYDLEWGPDKWNPDYRVNKTNVAVSGTSPCKTECPAHISIQGYIKLAAQGRYKDALELIKHENPFPAVCGRICPRNCESACTRGDIDSPIAIDEIKKFIAEQDLNKEHRYIPKKRHEYRKKIAVIGSGPSGLACAYYLAVDGYEVTVFEKEKVLGGMLTLGIPSFRLEKDIVKAEIDILKELGVEFKTGVNVGKDISLADLRATGFEAFYIAIGAQKGKSLGIEGELSEGVTTGVEFLKAVNLDNAIKINGKAIIIGGGNVAIDAARTASRIGSDEVSMYCLESRKEMPALLEEIDEALEEGIIINNSWGPYRIITKNNHVTAVEFKRCLSVFDANHSFNPQFSDNETITVPADQIIISVGQEIQWGELLKDSKALLNPNNTIKADGFTLQSHEPDVFVGGDAYTGPRFAIDAIASGKQAAISIHRYVQPGQSLTIGRDRRDYRSLDKNNLELNGYDKMMREKPIYMAAQKDTSVFRDLRGTFTEEQLKKETERCLSCGAVTIDEYLCVGCGQCTTKCKFDAISLMRKYDKSSVEIKKLRPTVAKYIVKRKVKIAMRRLKDIFIPS